MITKCLQLLLFTIGVNALICPTGQQPCGTVGCYDPNIQGCSTSGNGIECINFCNGTCYSNNQYCYNNTLICNNGESVCDVRGYAPMSPYSSGRVCYNPSQMTCWNHTICSRQYSCGSRCYTAFNSACVNNETICQGSQYWVPYYFPTARVCGPQKDCYDNTTGVCLNGSTVCPGLNAQLCGSTCYNTSSAVCVNGTVQCINSCNGTCYSNNQYCYNNTLICNNGESVCDVRGYAPMSPYSSGRVCYNPSQMTCWNHTICSRQYSCGSRCYTAFNSACVNNETICQGSQYWIPYYFPTARVCGPQKQCYDNMTGVCLNGSTVCLGLDAQLCGSTCYNTSTAVCVNGTVQCINSCNGTCYSNNQYCYNNTLVCNNGESVCDVRGYAPMSPYSSGRVCYNSSQMTCWNHTICSRQYSCGSRCYTTFNSACVNNETICQGSQYWIPYYFPTARVCGPQKQCYDTSTSVCMENIGTVCAIGSQLCSGVCYNPQSQYCINGNNTIYCLSNPTSSNCPSSSTSSSNPTTLTTTTTMSEYNRLDGS